MSFKSDSKYICNVLYCVFHSILFYAFGIADYFFYHFYSVTFVKPFSLYPYLIRDVVLKPDNIIILI